jgi:hypothetical protein
MMLAAKMDEFGKAAWIAATILGFWLFWPVGLAILAFLGWTGRLRTWRAERRGRWYNTDGTASGGCGWGPRQSYAPPSGNKAFDDYRAETLRRLEEEQKEFVDYLERLRQAKDKAEFDAFMAERRRGPQAPDATQAG